VSEPLQKERLQKLLARAGVASRRAAEELIQAGRVRVNGRVASLGDSALETDLIEVNGRPLEFAQSHTTFALYKPRGVVTSADDEFGRRNVLEIVPRVPGLHPVGRLDFLSEGLLILTTDGQLTLELTHPRYQHEKEYRVWTDPEPTLAQLETLRRGVELEDGIAKPKRIQAANDGFRIIITEGRNRLIRRMAEAVELEVTRLKRTRIGEFDIGGARVGEWLELNSEEIQQLKAR
jgi:23S rRNA pseudouridine2605 synthase